MLHRFQGGWKNKRNCIPEAPFPVQWPKKFGELSSRSPSGTGQPDPFEACGLAYFGKIIHSRHTSDIRSVPWCLMTRVVFGIEVTKELTPRWVLGPLVAALYIKIVKGICFLYIFCFNQAIRFVEHVPSYYMVTYSSVIFLNDRFCQPRVDVKNMDYKALVREKLKQWKEWALERYLDYVESIWPYYCRTIRFLKKANFL